MLGLFIIILVDYFFNKSLISVNKSVSDGPAGAGASTGFLVLLYAFTRRNITKPTNTKLIMEFNQAPYLMAFSGFTYAPFSNTASLRIIFISAKS